MEATRYSDYLYQFELVIELDARSAVISTLQTCQVRLRDS